MIAEFDDKRLEAFYDGDTGAIGKNFHRRASAILSLLDVVESIEQLKRIAQPGYNLHPLKGNLADFWSMTVSGNWRIIFRFVDGEAYEIQMIDYH